MTQKARTLFPLWTIFPNSSIDKHAAAAADPKTAEAASPRSVHNDTHSVLLRRVTMKTKEFSKRGGNPSRTAAVRLFA